MLDDILKTTLNIGAAYVASEIVANNRHHTQRRSTRSHRTPQQLSDGIYSTSAKGLPEGVKEFCKVWNQKCKLLKIASERQIYAVKKVRNNYYLIDATDTCVAYIVWSDWKQPDITILHGLDTVSTHKGDSYIHQWIRESLEAFSFSKDEIVGILSTIPVDYPSDDDSLNALLRQILSAN